MAKKKDKASEGPDSRDEKMKEIKSLVNSNSEDAAKVLKMWLSKAGTDKDKK
jgi:flagellar biosynthesis/type III secretory pathway M-ring protein FliF/YscJ|tara:strand:- start:86 stop:241 length:156 start_codon:yes stop_codon:yes gene_type:complete